MSPSSSDRLRNLKATLRSLLVSNKLRMTDLDLARDYRQMEGGHIPYSEYGYRNLLDFLKGECSDILQVTKENQYNIVSPIISKEIEHINSLIEKQKVSMTNTRYSNKRQTRSSIIDNSASHKNYSASQHSNELENKVSKKSSQVQLLDCVQRNLKVLIKEQQQMWSHQLIDEYYKRYSQSLEYEKLGFNDVVSLCRSMPDVFTIHRPQKFGDWKLCDVEIKSNCVENVSPVEKLQIDESQSKLDLDNIIFGVDALPGISLDPTLCPENCVYGGFEIPRAANPSVGSQIHVLLSEVVDPLHFWFHIVSEDSTEALDIMMRSINKFYTSSNSYKMVRAQMKVGQYCAVPFEGYYHRAEILANIDINIVKVRYIDYGTVLNVPSNSLRLLLKDYCELPQQAIRGQLAGVSPVNGQWSSVARRRFLGLVTGVVFNANVLSTCTNNISCMGLMDSVSEKTCRIIAKVLYLEGLGNLDQSDKYWNYEECQYLLPTFEDLEMGRAPNFSELEDEENINILFNKTVGLSDNSEGSFPATNDFSKVNPSKKFAQWRTEKVLLSDSPIEESLNDEEDQKFVAELIRKQRIKNNLSDIDVKVSKEIPGLNDPDSLVDPKNYDSNSASPQFRNHSGCLPPLNYYPPFNYPPFNYPPQPYQNYYNLRLQPYNNYNEWMMPVPWIPYQSQPYNTSVQYTIPPPPIMRQSPWAYTQPNPLSNTVKTETNESKSDDLENVDENMINTSKGSNLSEDIVAPSCYNEGESSKHSSSESSMSLVSSIELNDKFEAQRKLVLVGKAMITGFNLEIWRLNCIDDEANAFVIVEQFANLFLDCIGKTNLLQNIYSDNNTLNITFMRYHELPDIISDIVKVGNSNLSIGEGIMINTLTKEIPNSRGYFALLPLENIVDTLFSYNNNLKTKIRDIIKDIVSVIKTYS